MNLPFSPPNSEPDGSGSAFAARPIVAVRRQDRSVWWFAGGALIAAALLFSALEARRRGLDAADVQSAGAAALAPPEAIPDLIVPDQPIDAALGPAGQAGWAQPGDRPQPLTSPGRASLSQTPAGQQNFTPQQYYDAAPYAAPPPPMAGGQDGLADAGRVSAAAPLSAANPSAGRVAAGRLENPATTVVQGTLINAVLETALDSTRPGQTRAVVTRDVYGFDGTRLLIPRGTRLYGTYDADVAQGQKRAQIRWSRLLRPDGVSVALDSPAADPLGRAGVEGKVNNHFFQRFGNALLGTTANIGSALVTQGIGSTSPVIVAVPGATQSASQSIMPATNQITPTLTVRQGTRITVFVQHDLDFTAVDEAH